MATVTVPGQACDTAVAFKTEAAAIETTALLERYIQLAFTGHTSSLDHNRCQCPLPQIFSQSLQDIEIKPTLRKNGVNRILLYTGGFHPPHISHRAVLYDGFFRSGADLNLIAAILLPWDDPKEIIRSDQRRIILPHEDCGMLWTGGYSVEPSSQRCLLEKPSQERGVRHQNTTENGSGMSLDNHEPSSMENQLLSTNLKDDNWWEPTIADWYLAEVEETSDLPAAKQVPSPDKTWTPGFKLNSPSRLAKSYRKTLREHLPTSFVEENLGENHLGSWAFVYPNGERHFKQFKENLQSCLQEDGFVIEFVRLFGSDHVTEYITPSGDEWDHRIIILSDAGRALGTEFEQEVKTEQAKLNTSDSASQQRMIHETPSDTSKDELAEISTGEHGKKSHYDSTGAAEIHKTTDEESLPFPDNSSKPLPKRLIHYSPWGSITVDQKTLETKMRYETAAAAEHRTALAYRNTTSSQTKILSNPTGSPLEIELFLCARLRECYSSKCIVRYVPRFHPLPEPFVSSTSLRKSIASSSDDDDIISRINDVALNANFLAGMVANKCGWPMIGMSPDEFEQLKKYKRSLRRKRRCAKRRAKTSKTRKSHKKPLAGTWRTQRKRFVRKYLGAISAEWPWYE